MPDLDLFTVRINVQLDKFVSSKADHVACHTNALTFFWSVGLHYAFPPFNIIEKILKKIQDDRATLLVNLPLWPTQVWFPRALQLLVENPRNYIFLPQDPSLKHPRSTKLKLMAMVLSGNPLKDRVFRQKLRSFYLDPGSMRKKNNIGHISRDGCYFFNGKNNPFQPPVNMFLDFLLDGFKKGKGKPYRTMNTISSSISAIANIDVRPLGQIPLVSRFIKAVFQERPGLPRYNITRDPEVVLQH